VDTVRYYCCSSAPYGSDLNFAEDSLTAMHNSELADVLGNLVNRVLNLTKKFCDGKVPDVPHDEAFPIPLNLQELKAVIKHDIDRCSIHTAIAKAMEAVRNTNK
jgi:methionyl-tRNA synthetase